jgi:hypothetical protein
MLSVTKTLPTVPGGATAVTVVLLTKVVLKAGVDPNNTLVVLGSLAVLIVKFNPVRVMLVPPEDDPEGGERLERVGVPYRNKRERSGK